GEVHCVRGRLAAPAKRILAGGDIDIVGPPTPAGPFAAVSGFTDVLGTGNIDVLTNGNITLTEVAGDLRAGLIRSTALDVFLTAQDGNIVDAPDGSPLNPPAGDDPSDVTGRNVYLKALKGGPGYPTNTLDIDSSTPTQGELDAVARDSIFITEFSGNLFIGNGVPLGRTVGVESITADVRLNTRPGSGSILDAQNDNLTDVEGTRIDLVANGGSIGLPGHDLDTNSNYP